MIPIIGGGSGQVLAKASGGDFDVEWVDQSGGGGGVTTLTAALNANITIVNPADTSWQTMTGMSIDYTAGVYRFELFILSSTSDATIDPRVRVVTSEGETTYSTDLDNNIAVTFTTAGFNMAHTNTSTRSASALGCLVCTGSGTLTVEWGTGTTGTATLTAYAGTHMVLMKVADSA